MTTRSEMIRSAAALPKGSTERRQILAELAKESSPTMGEDIAFYQGLADAFTRNFRIRLLDLQHQGGLVVATFRNPGTRLRAEKLQMYIRLYKVTFITADTKHIILEWVL